MRYVFLASILLLAPKLAHAHAILVQSQPADKAAIAPGERAVVLRYNSRIDHQLSRLTLQGTNAQMTLPLDPNSPADTLSAKAELTPGTYVIHWQVLATDGHMTRGDVHFTVK